MTVKQLYLITVDSQRIVILELGDEVYDGYFYLIPSEFLDKIVKKMYIDLQRGAIVLCIAKDKI